MCLTCWTCRRCAGHAAYKGGAGRGGKPRPAPNHNRRKRLQKWLKKRINQSARPRQNAPLGWLKKTQKLQHAKKLERPSWLPQCWHQCATRSGISTLLICWTLLQKTIWLQWSTRFLHSRPGIKECANTSAAVRQSRSSRGLTGAPPSTTKTCGFTASVNWLRASTEGVRM